MDDLNSKTVTTAESLVMSSAPWPSSSNCTPHSLPSQHYPDILQPELIEDMRRNGGRMSSHSALEGLLAGLGGKAYNILCCCLCTTHDASLW